MKRHPFGIRHNKRCIGRNGLPCLKLLLRVVIPKGNCFRAWRCCCCTRMFWLNPLHAFHQNTFASQCFHVLPCSIGVGPNHKLILSWNHGQWVWVHIKMGRVPSCLNFPVPSVGQQHFPNVHVVAIVLLLSPLHHHGRILVKRNPLRKHNDIFCVAKNGLIPSYWLEHLVLIPKTKHYVFWTWLGQ